MKLIIILLILMVCPAFAFDDETTHRQITAKAIDTSFLSSYLKTNLALQEGASTLIKDNKTISWWLIEGSHDEDRVPSMCRASNHFHNPLKPWDQAGLTGYQGPVSLAVDARCSATPYTQKNSNVVWGTGYLSPSPDGAKRYTNNDMDWYNARTFYNNALTASLKTDRETNFANTFYALGHVIHLLEDMAVPAHVRNDFKSHLDNMSNISLSLPTAWPENPFERYVRLHPATVTTITNPPVISATRLTDFWDTDQYTGSNPLITSFTAGLSEYTNANFASNYTIFTENRNPSDTYYFPHPAKSETEYYEEYTGHHIVDRGISYNIYRKYYRKTAGEPIEHFAYAGRLHRYLSGYAEQTNTLGVDEEQVNSDYAQKLLPKAVGYSAGLLNYFFRGQIDMEKDPNLEQYIIKNNSSLENMAGTFSLYYDDVSGNRSQVPGASWNITISATGQSSPVTFIEPSSPAPKEPGKYILVFTGTMGNEAGTIVGKVVNLALQKLPMMVIVSNNPNDAWSFGNIEVDTGHGIIKGNLPMEKLMTIDAVRFDINDRDTFVILSKSNENATWYCNFHKYFIDESTLTLQYQGVALREKCHEEQVNTTQVWEEISESGVEKVFNNEYTERSVYYPDFFLENGMIKPIGVIMDYAYSIPSCGFYSHDGSFINDCFGVLRYVQYTLSQKLYYGGVMLRETMPYNCTGGYLQGLHVESCQPVDGLSPRQADDMILPVAVFNQSDYVYRIYKPDGTIMGSTTLPVDLSFLNDGRYGIKTMLRNDNKYSFYETYADRFKPPLRSYSSKLGVIDCGNFLMSEKNLNGGYLGWFGGYSTGSTGGFISLKSCSDWKFIRSTYGTGENSYGGPYPTSYIFDVSM